MLPIIDSLISSGTDLIKSYFPPDMTPEERSKAERELARMQSQAREQALSFQTDMERELTERLKADMQSDSWLSKNVRPLVLIYLMGAWTLFAGFSLYNHQVNPEYVEMLKQMLMAAFGFYFVSRGVEKVTSILKPNKNS